MRQFHYIFAFIFATFIGLLALGCSEDDDNPATGPSVNHAPVIISVTASPDTIRYYIPDHTYRHDIATLSCIAMDDNQDNLEYVWEASEGFFFQPASGPSVQWSNRNRGGYWVRVSVSDGIEFTTDSVNVYVQ